MRQTIAAILGAGMLGLVSTPAEARLGDAYPRFASSHLVAGNRLFRYEGRVGARFRFGPGRENTLGNPLMYIDTQDGVIVQQVLILPLPRRSREEGRLASMTKLFLEDAGLEDKDLEQALGAFKALLSNGKTVQRALGPSDRLMLDLFANPQSGHALIAIGFKPTDLMPGATP
ncbi:MAG: hypothetical protein VKP62_09095 [Candidatus Sericytochromatia bacterium]|nr:hypothetical protein [Candidatus Sericytochromatia bacterium]